MEEKVVGSDSTESASSKRRREEKIRKRDPRAWENIYKSITALPEPEKIEVISKKYSELYDEFRKVSQNCQNLEKNCTILQKEKEHMRAEQAKAVIARSRLENLCRELQKQNKQIKEENIAKIKEEEERRKEVAAKFQKTLDEVTSMMNENREKNFKLRDDNIDMSKKISELYAEFQKREEDIKRMAKQMDLEKQLSKATITKLEYELKAEKELWAKERNILQNNLEESENRNKHLLENIKGMEEHLSVYKGQYEDFESTLDKSNKIFDNCKAEMVKMSKHIVLLEKEVNNWKSKWQASAKSLIELSTAKQAQDLHLAAADKKIEQLQKLCRQLQVDRASFLKLLKANGIEPVTQPCIENPEKPPTPKERELAILKDSLRMLQEQLKNSLSATGETVESKDLGSTKIENNEASSTNVDSSNPVKTESENTMNMKASISEENVDSSNSFKTEGEITINMKASISGENVNGDEAVSNMCDASITTLDSSEAKVCLDSNQTEIKTGNIKSEQDTVIVNNTEEIHAISETLEVQKLTQDVDIASSTNEQQKQPSEIAENKDAKCSSNDSIECKVDLENEKAVNIETDVASQGVIESSAKEQMEDEASMSES